MQNVKTGQLGETIAAHFLQSNGMELLERNFRTKTGEIDIIASECGTLVFIEVKSTRGNRFGQPEEWVDEKKQKQVLRVAEEYLVLKQIADIQCRFDVVTIQLGQGQDGISHYKNAFW